MHRGTYFYETRLDKITSQPFHLFICLLLNAHHPAVYYVVTQNLIDFWMPCHVDFKNLCYNYQNEKVI